jgi:hypothetical protein
VDRREGHTRWLDDRLLQIQSITPCGDKKSKIIPPPLLLLRLVTLAQRFRLFVSDKKNKKEFLYATDAMSRQRVDFGMSDNAEITDKLAAIDCKDASSYFTLGQLQKYLTSIGATTTTTSTESMCRVAKKNLPTPAVKLGTALRSERSLLDSSSSSPDDFDTGSVGQLPFFKVRYVPQTGSMPLPMRHATPRGAEVDRAWSQLLEEYDRMDDWISRINNDLQLLDLTPTGSTILKMIATFYQPGEIILTNENSTRISADIYKSEVNIPSVPRKVCYYDPSKRLTSTETWVVLGHELIHMLHSKLGLHFDGDSPSEEENTVQGKLGGSKLPPGPPATHTYSPATHTYSPATHTYSPIVSGYDTGRTLGSRFMAGGLGGSMPPLDMSVVEDVTGRRWRLTENQFRLEAGMLKRNGYGSIPVCTSFNKAGCQLYQQYGDKDTCQVLDDKSDPSIVKLRGQLERYSK